jgi:hypothetical protein
MTDSWLVAVVIFIGLLLIVIVRLGKSGKGQP